MTPKELKGSKKKKRKRLYLEREKKRQSYDLWLVALAKKMGLERESDERANSMG